MMRMFLVATALVVFASSDAAAVVFTADDLVSRTGNNLVHTDSHTGDRSELADVLRRDRAAS
jgi:hypothetical protein